MDDFLNWLASWKGIPVEKGSELRFEFLALPGGGLGLLTVLAILAALVAIVLVYRRDARSLSRGKRVLLATLRTLAVLFAALLLLEPSLVAYQRETRPGRTILLLDLSQSMNQVDAFRREGVQELAESWRRLGIEDPANATRMDLARALLAHEDGVLLEKLAARNELDVYGFSSGLEPLPILAETPEGTGNGPEPDEGGTGNDLPPPPELDLAGIRPDGRYSNLGGAVRAALDRSKGSEIAGVVVLSDGRRNAGPQGAEIARMLSQRKVPVTFVLGIGDPSETRMLRVTRLEAPDKVFQRDPFEVAANVQSQGHPSVTVPVRLMRADDDGAEQEVASEQVTLGEGRPEERVVFEGLTSRETGMFTYRVEIEPPPGEPVVDERHVRRQRIEVLGEQTRVLLLAGSANYEYRRLLTHLERDRTIEVTAWLQSADPDFPQDGNEGVTIEELPTARQELDVYDVMIFVDPNAAKLGRTFCEWCARHVLEDGAGLWWVCGEKFTLDALRPEASTAPLVELLPVVVDLRTADLALIGFGKGFPVAWPYRLTTEGVEGVAAKVVRIAGDEDTLPHLWGRLRGFHLTYPVERLKPAATALVETTNTDSVYRMENGEPCPVFATHFIGAGRVMFSGTDETWRWLGAHEEAYNRWWVKGIRYLFEGRLNAGNSRFKVLLSDEKLELGESIKLIVEARNEAYRPLVQESVELVLAVDDELVEAIELQPVEDVPGRYRATYRPVQTGFYGVMHSEHPDAAVSFQVVPAAIEKEGPVDLSELGAIAGVEGGRLAHTPQELIGGLDTIPSRTATDTYRTPHAVWDSWLTLAVVVTLLCAEWWLRKRFNLL